MFDFLKKKITGFVDKLTKKEEQKESKEVVEEKAVEEIVPEKKPEKIEVPEEKPPEKKIEKPKPEPKAEKVELPKKAKPIPKPLKQVSKIDSTAVKPKKEEPIPKKVKVGKPKPIKEEVKPEEIPKPEIKEEKPVPEKKVEKPEEIKPVEKAEKPKPKAKPETPKPETLKPEPRPKTPEPETIEEKPAVPEFKPEEKRKPGIQLSPLKAIKSFITREVEISDSDVHELLENLELELLEADVEIGVAENIRQELSEKLVGAKVAKKEINSFIKATIRDTLVDLMTSERAFDLLEYMEKSEKPVKIVFLGLNGTGKTTSIAKVAHLLMQNKYKVVFAAADTFRAAAIEQMEVHANRLKVKLIKRDYGADPTSVGYDAISYAKAHGIDAVLVDTAGRQDTNINLINELKKMNRVLKPDLKLYVGESIAGSSAIEQISTFNEEIGIDGVILTKLDCDPKGGTILSITKATGIPVIYIGVGQKYEDLERFEPEKIIDRLFA